MSIETLIGFRKIPQILLRREKATNDGTSSFDPAGSFNEPCNFNNQQIEINSKPRHPILLHVP